MIKKAEIPRKPGVYIFKDLSGNILYVGKAINLHHRVASYFGPVHAARTQELAKRIETADTIVVESELEALILEANLIKKYLPPFNVRLTDDKDYLYIAVTKEDFPKVITARKKELKAMRKFWGPYPSSRTVKNTLKIMRRVFPWCANPPKHKLVSSENIKTSHRPCFYFHLGLCPGACAGTVSKTEYGKIISRFSKFLDGKKDELVSQLSKEMKQASGEMRFEEAGRVKRTLSGITYLTQANRTKLYLENPNFLQSERQSALEQLKKDLNLPTLPERIEGYDISNIQGKEATGSMVVLTAGEIDKSQYRKFKIHITGKPNDVGMHKEMLKRRLKHDEWTRADLILIDGGRGQVRGAFEELQAVKKNIPVYGLAKRMEWLYPPEGEVIKLSKKSLSLKLLQKLRDEAHRFAISYHRKLRGKSFLSF